jgi:hypothetical protein
LRIGASKIGNSCGDGELTLVISKWSALNVDGAITTFKNSGRIGDREFLHKRPITKKNVAASAGSVRQWGKLCASRYRKVLRMGM